MCGKKKQIYWRVIVETVYKKYSKVQTPEIWFKFHNVNNLTFNDEGPYHIETSPSIFMANQSIGFYMIGTCIMKKLNDLSN